MTKRESILRALTTLMADIPGVPNDAVFRSRILPFSRHQIPAIAVEFVSDNPDPEMLPAPIISWAMTVRIMIFTVGEAPDQAADPIVQAVHSKLSGDLSLGGLVMDIQASGVKNELVDGDAAVGVVSLDYRVQYRTNTTNLT